MAVLGYIHLAAYDGFDACVFSLHVKIDGAVHSTVIGDCQGIHPQFFSAFDQLGYLAHAVQQAELGMNMEMFKHQRSSIK